MLYPKGISIDAKLTFISRKTSYLQVWRSLSLLATDRPSPSYVTWVRSSIGRRAHTSTCPWLDHLVSGFFVKLMKCFFWTYFHCAYLNHTLSSLHKKLVDSLCKRNPVYHECFSPLVSRSFHSLTIVLFTLSLTVLRVIHFEVYFGGFEEGSPSFKEGECLLLPYTSEETSWGTGRGYVTLFPVQALEKTRFPFSFTTTHGISFDSKQEGTKMIQFPSL